MLINKKHFKAKYKKWVTIDKSMKKKSVNIRKKL